MKGRRKMLRRKTSLRPKVAVKRVNVARKAKNWIRAYGSVARVAFVAKTPCLMCGSLPSENAHIESDGMGRKADASKVIALCHPCHALQHRIGWLALLGTTRWKQRITEAAAALEAQWQAVSREMR